MWEQGRDNTIVSRSIELLLDEGCDRLVFCCSRLAVGGRAGEDSSLLGACRSKQFDKSNGEEQIGGELCRAVAKGKTREKRG